MTKFNVKELRQKVLASDDIKHSEVHVPEWDVTLPVRTLSASDMKKVMKVQEDNVRMMILAVLYGCKTPEGEAVFEEKDLAHFEANKAFGPVMHLAQQILELSGFDDDSVKEAKNS